LSKPGSIDRAFVITHIPLLVCQLTCSHQRMQPVDIINLCYMHCMHCPVMGKGARSLKPRKALRADYAGREISWFSSSPAGLLLQGGGRKKMKREREREREKERERERETESGGEQRGARESDRKKGRFSPALLVTAEIALTSCKPILRKCKPILRKQRRWSTEE